MKIVKNILIISLIIIESIFIHLTYKSLINKPSNINEIKVVGTDEILSSKTFAILLGDGAGNYTESPDRSEWPSMEEYA